MDLSECHTVTSERRRWWPKRCGRAALLFCFGSWQPASHIRSTNQTRTDIQMMSNYQRSIISLQRKRNWLAEMTFHLWWMAVEWKRPHRHRNESNKSLKMDWNSKTRPDELIGADERNEYGQREVSHISNNRKIIIWTFFLRIYWLVNSMLGDVGA